MGGPAVRGNIITNFLCTCYAVQPVAVGVPERSKRSFEGYQYPSGPSDATGRDDRTQ